MNIYSIYKRHDILCEVDTGDYSEVQQEFAHETDINTIVNKYLRTGYIPPETVNKAFLDVSNLGDYQDILERIKGAQDSFMALPSTIRDRFSNDPAAFHDFMANLDDSTLEEALDLGLVNRQSEGVGTGTLLDVTVPTDTKIEKED